MKILGFKVRFTGGTLFLIALITVFFGFNLMGVFPTLPLVAYALAGFSAGVLLVLSVLLHELAHSVVARRNGIEIKEIFINLFGGASVLKNNPPSPGVDFRVAAVGPFTSIILGILFYGLAFVLASFNAPGIAIIVAVYLSIANIFLALLNLLPGAPLDGGRITRSIAWKITGSFKKGALFAANLGIVIAVLLGLFGIASTYLGFGWLTGFWAIYFAWTMGLGAYYERKAVKLGLFDDDGQIQQDGRQS